MDTTSLSFEGQGGAERGRCGHSKAHRPDLHQMIVGLVMDQDGRPLCCELWPGNTADVTTLLPVLTGCGRGLASAASASSPTAA
jgi:transposase